MSEVQYGLEFECCSGHGESLYFGHLMSSPDDTPTDFYLPVVISDDQYNGEVWLTPDDVSKIVDYLNSIVVEYERKKDMPKVGDIVEFPNGLSDYTYKILSQVELDGELYCKLLRLEDEGKIVNLIPVSSLEKVEPE